MTAALIAAAWVLRFATLLAIGASLYGLWLWCRTVPTGSWASGIALAAILSVNSGLAFFLWRVDWTELLG